MATRVIQTTRDQIPTKAEFPEWANATNLFYESEWMMLRDCMLGEKQVKSRRTDYLPQFKGFDASEYKDYLERASFYNMVARTVSGMLGTLYRRNPIASNVPANVDINTMGFEGESLYALMRDASQDVIHVSRIGALVDRDPDGESDPYIVLYPVETIIDWTYGVVKGKRVPIEIILSETKTYAIAGEKNVTRREYRKLVLQGNVYRQHVYSSTKDRDAEITDTPEVYTPTKRGVPLDYIPFVFMNTTTNKADVERPFLSDIARLNISHFNSSAQLEHGRFYTGLPIYYCSADSNDKTEFTLGPSTVWKLPQAGKAGIIEFNGSGLKSLETALEQKESQAASLGGRLIGVSTQSTAESDNMTAMKERNENAILLNIAFSIETGFTKLVRWIAWWKDNSDTAVEKIEVECSKDFMLKPVGAREFRAMHMMYTDGLIPVDVMYDYLRRAEVIPDWLEMKEFTQMLKSKNSFPGQPDAEARLEGFPDARAKLTDEFDRDELDTIESMQKDKLTLEAKEADKDRKSDEKKAKEAAKAAKEAAKNQPVNPQSGDRTGDQTRPGGVRPPNR